MARAVSNDVVVASVPPLSASPRRRRPGWRRARPARCRRDRRAAAVGIGAAQHQRPGAGLGQRGSVPAGRGIGGLVGQRRADREAIRGVGQRERAMRQVVAGGPGQAVAGQVLQRVRRLARVDAQVVHGAGEAAGADPGEVTVDAAGGVDQHDLGRAGAVDAAQPEGHVGAERHRVGAQRRAVGAGGEVESGVVGHADIARRPQRRRPLHRQRAARARHLQVAGQPAGRARGAIAILQRPARHLRRTAQLSQHHQFAARHRGLAQEGAIGARQERGAGDLVQAVRAAARAQQPCREPVGGIGMVEAQRGDARAELDRAGVERARTRSRLARSRADIEGAAGGKDQEPVRRQRHDPRAGGADVDSAALPDRQGARARSHAEAQDHRTAVVPGGTGAAHHDFTVAAHAAHIAVAVRDGAARLDAQGALAGYVAHPELAGIGPGRTAPRHQEIAAAVLLAPDDAVDAGDIPSRQD